MWILLVYQPFQLIQLKGKYFMWGTVYQSNLFLQTVKEYIQLWGEQHSDLLLKNRGFFKKII